ncbi:MAG TPA: hypothetical protein VMW58_01930 [Anaerolineae bacterium]|nr:hypothetical protein [Anaerolineae bacterium]
MALEPGATRQSASSLEHYYQNETALPWFGSLPAEHQGRPGFVEVGSTILEYAP